MTWPVEKLLEALDEHGGTLVVTHDKEGGECLVALYFGREAPDSPMVGGATHGVGETIEDALSRAARDLL